MTVHNFFFLKKKIALRINIMNENNTITVFLDFWSIELDENIVSDQDIDPELLIRKIYIKKNLDIPLNGVKKKILNLVVLENEEQRKDLVILPIEAFYVWTTYESYNNSVLIKSDLEIITYLLSNIVYNSTRDSKRRPDNANEKIRKIIIDTDDDQYTQSSSFTIHRLPVINLTFFRVTDRKIWRNISAYFNNPEQVSYKNNKGIEEFSSLYTKNTVTLSVEKNFPLAVFVCTLFRRRDDSKIPSLHLNLSSSIVLSQLSTTEFEQVNKVLKERVHNIKLMETRDENNNYAILAHLVMDTECTLKNENEAPSGKAVTLYQYHKRKGSYYNTLLDVVKEYHSKESSNKSMLINMFSNIYKKIQLKSMS